MSRFMRLLPRFIIASPITSWVWSGVFCGLLSGILLSGAYPGVLPGILPEWAKCAASILAWMALTPAFYWVFRQAHQQPCGQALFLRLLWPFFMGLLVGGVFHGVAWAWLWGLHPLMWLGLNPAQSLLATMVVWLLATGVGALLYGLIFMLFWAVAHISWLCRTGWLCLLLWPACWLLGHALAERCALYVPWAVLSYSQAIVPFWRWAAFYTGQNGLIAIIIASNTLWALISVYRLRLVGFRRLKRWLWPGVLLGMLALALIRPAYLPMHRPAGLPVVALMKASRPIEQIRGGQLRPAMAWADYIEPLRQSALPVGAWVVLPEEGVLTEPVNEARPLDNPMLWALYSLAQQHGWVLATGGQSFRANSPDETQAINTFNSLIWLNPVAEQPEERVQVYHKRQLVPFGETVPQWPGVLPATWLDQLMNRFQVPYHVGEFNRGRWQAPLLIKQVRARRLTVGSLVCFELLYPQLAWQVRQHGAQILVNTSNLGWFHGHPMLDAQFMAMAQMRAAEVRLPVVVSANTGVSAIVDATGEVLLQSKPEQKGLLIWRDRRINLK